MIQSPHPSGVGPVRPWWLLVGGLAVIGLGGALVGGAANQPESSAAATSTSRSTEASTAAPSTPSVSAVPSSAVPSTPATVPPTPATVPPTTTAVGTPTGVDFVMPDLVGSDLQSAQDTVQELGVSYSVSHDLLGGRNQVIDSNWIVCDQNVAPGQRVAGDVEGQLDFGVVKREERCP